MVRLADAGGDVALDLGTPALQAGAGLPRVTLHELRHTHATVLLRDGVPVHIVAKRLGHRDPSVTLNVYADGHPRRRPRRRRVHPGGVRSMITASVSRTGWVQS